MEKKEKLHPPEYKLIKKIGKGSFGSVYQGLEVKSGKTVAIKIIDLETTDDDIDDIKKEIEMLSDCLSPNITKYYASVIFKSELWIIMEFLEGSVMNILEKGPIPEEYIAVIARETLKGLSYLHQRGKIHRDIKAANLLLSKDCDIKLADFGVSGQITATMTKRNTFVGTPYWMSPEVIQQNNYDTSADIWSFGITLLEMAEGQPPFSDLQPMRAIFMIPKSPAPRLNGNRFSKYFKDFISLCLQSNPKQRSTVDQLLQHKFIQNAKSKSILIDLLTRIGDLSIVDDDDASDDSQSQRDWSFSYDETIKLANKPEKNDTVKKSLFELSNDNDDDWSEDENKNQEIKVQKTLVPKTPEEKNDEDTGTVCIRDDGISNYNENFSLACDNLSIPPSHHKKPIPSFSQIDFDVDQLQFSKEVTPPIPPRPQLKSNPPPPVNLPSHNTFVRRAVQSIIKPGTIKDDDIKISEQDLPFEPSLFFPNIISPVLNRLHQKSLQQKNKSLSSVLSSILALFSQLQAISPNMIAEIFLESDQELKRHFEDQSIFDDIAQL